MDDRKAALELLGCLLTSPLNLGPPGLTSRVVGQLDPVIVAAKLAACNIAVLDPANPNDLAHIAAISAILADLIDNGLAKSANAPPNVINCIVAQVQPPGGGS